MLHYPHYHDSGYEPDIESLERKAKGQDEIILAYMQKHRAALTPFQVYLNLKYVLKGAPITSIRRSLTTLTAKGLLVKSDERVKGDLGKLNYTWRAV